MIPYFCFDKIIIGPITIYVWGIFVALAFLFGYLFLLRQVRLDSTRQARLNFPLENFGGQAKKEKINTDIIHNLVIWIFLGAIIGARLGYILQFSEQYFSQPLEILKIWQGGLTFHGGLLGILIAAIIYFKLTKTNFKLFWQIADLFALSAPISIAIGRIGCSLINDHQGAETSLPWGIIWPDGMIRHPVAEYLIINALILFLILRFLRPELKKPGQLFFSFLFLYSVSRFFLDFTRSTGTALSDIHYFNLSTAQWLSLIIILGIMGVIIVRYFKRSRI